MDRREKGHIINCAAKIKKWNLFVEPNSTINKRQTFGTKYSFLGAQAYGQLSRKHQQLPLIMSYPLGSFPRYGHQERWAQERRERAIANSIATRQAKKRCRVLREEAGLFAFKEVLPWANKQFKGIEMTPELVLLGDSICQRMTRTIENWNRDTEHRKSYLKQIAEVAADTKQLLDRVNGSGSEFMERWGTVVNRIENEKWCIRWAAGA
jgi:hypothetical protein